MVAIDNSPVTRLPHLLLAQEHGGQVPLNPTAPKKDLRPADAWFRVLVEGESAAPADAVREVRVHFEGTRQSLRRGGWTAPCQCSSSNPVFKSCKRRTINPSTGNTVSASNFLKRQCATALGHSSHLSDDFHRLQSA